MSNRSDEEREAAVNTVVNYEESEFEQALTQLRQPHYPRPNSTSALHSPQHSNKHISRASSMPADDPAVAHLLSNERAHIDREEDSMSAFGSLIKEEPEHQHRQPPAVLSKHNRPTQYRYTTPLPHTKWGFANKTPRSDRDTLGAHSQAVDSVIDMFPRNDTVEPMEFEESLEEGSNHVAIDMPAGNDIDYIDEEASDPEPVAPFNYHDAACYDYGGGNEGVSASNQFERIQQLHRSREEETNDAQEMVVRQFHARRGNPEEVMEPQNEMSHNFQVLRFGNGPPFGAFGMKPIDEKVTPEQLERRETTSRKHEKLRTQRVLEHDDTVRKPRKKKQHVAEKTVAELCAEAAVENRGTDDIDTVLAFIGATESNAVRDKRAKPAAKKIPKAKTIKKKSPVPTTESSKSTSSNSSSDEGVENTSSTNDDVSTTTTVSSSAAIDDQPIDWNDPKLYVNDDMDPCTLIETVGAADAISPSNGPGGFVAAHGRRRKVVPPKPTTQTHVPPRRFTKHDSVETKPKPTSPTDTVTTSVEIRREKIVQNGYNSKDFVDPPLTAELETTNTASQQTGGRSWATIVAKVSPTTTTEPAADLPLPCRPLICTTGDSDATVDTSMTSTVSVATTIIERVEQSEKPVVAQLTTALSSVTLVDSALHVETNTPSLVSPTAVFFSDEQPSAEVNSHVDVSFTWDKSLPTAVDVTDDEDEETGQQRIVMRCNDTSGDGRLIDMLVGTSMTRSASVDAPRNIVPPSAEHINAAKFMNKQFNTFKKNKPLAYGDLRTALTSRETPNRLSSRH